MKKPEKVAYKKWCLETGNIGGEEYYYVFKGGYKAGVYNKKGLIIMINENQVKKKIGKHIKKYEKRSKEICDKAKEGLTHIETTELIQIRQGIIELEQQSGY